MPYNNDSAIIEIRATADGYYIRAFKWEVSPPPIRFDIANALEKAITTDETTTRLERVVDNKTELNAVLTSFVSSVLRNPQAEA